MSRPPNHRCNWPKGQEEELRRLFGETYAGKHLTMSQIAQRLNITRGAVAGKLHTLGLKRGSASHSRRATKPRKRQLIPYAGAVRRAHVSES